VEGQLLNTKSTTANELRWYLRRIIYSPRPQSTRYSYVTVYVIM